MNQRTHSWIAIRAIALLDDENKEKNLAKLLIPQARKATVGAWIPDDIDAKRGGAGGMTDNHVLKMEPYKGTQVKRFVTLKKDLLQHIGIHRMVSRFLGDHDASLDDDWWKKPYKGDVSRPGQHLPNRAMALTTMMKDLLLMGNPTIDKLIPGDVRFAQYMDPNSRTHEEAAAMYFFMLSHFIADACMPCHCDGRKLSAYDQGLHKELESHWSRKVGTGFEKKNLLQPNDQLTPAQAAADGKKVLQQARDIDSKFGLDFSNTSIPDLIKGHDVWLEMIFVCRATFAVANVIAPPSKYPYDKPQVKAPFDEVLEDANPQLLKDVDKTVMYDAVLNTAIIWKHIWNKVTVD